MRWWACQLTWLWLLFYNIYTYFLFGNFINSWIWRTGKQLNGENGSYSTEEIRKIETQAPKLKGAYSHLSAFGFWKMLNTSPRKVGEAANHKLWSPLICSVRGDPRVWPDLDTATEGVDLGFFKSEWFLEFSCFWITFSSGFPKPAHKNVTYGLYHFILLILISYFKT